jgi:hypothetical protein
MKTVREIYRYGQAADWPARPELKPGEDFNTYMDLRMLSPCERKRLASMRERMALEELETIIGSIQDECETDR